MSSIHIIGGGLAGCEAAWQAAALDVPVTIHEMRPARPTAVHKTDGLAELERISVGLGAAAAAVPGGVGEGFVLLARLERLVLV